MVGLGYYVYNEAEKDALNVKTNLSYVSKEKTVLIVEIDNIQEQLQQIFSSNLIWSDFLKKDTSFVRIENTLNDFDLLFEKNNLKLTNSTISVISNADDLSFLLISELKHPVTLDSLLDFKNVRDFGDIFEIKLSNKTVFFKMEYGRLFCSDNKTILEKLNKTTSITEDKSFIEVYKTKAKKNSPVFLFANMSKLKKHLNFKLEHYIESSTWSAFDIKITQDALIGNGFLLNKSLNSISKQYSENFFNLTPSKIKKLSVLNFNSFDELNIDSNFVAKNNELCKCDFINDGLNWIENQVIHLATDFNNAQFIAFKLTDINSFNQGINQLTDSANKVFYSDSVYTIKKFKSEINLASTFNKNIKTNYYTIYLDYVIFGESGDDIRRLIYELKEGSTLKKNEELYDFYLANSSSNSFFKKIQKGFLLNTNLSDDGVSILESTVKQNNLVYTNFSYSKEISVGGSYHDPKWEIIFDYPLNSNIYLVDNHKTNDKEIVIQDTTNTLHFINTSGNTKWKKKIDGKIIDKIRKVDIFQNGKCQMLFNTSSNLYLVDVLGRNVPGFPVRLTNATNGVNMLDYNKDGNYRFMVATQKGIYSYNKLGKSIKGWENPKTKNKVITPIRHIVSNTKDYIFANDVNGKIYLYSRKGTIRYAVSSTFNGEYFPIDVGNSIETSRGIYWDKSRNELKKHFFNDQISTILTLPDSVLNFYYLDFDDNKEKNYVLETKTELYIYDKGGNVKEIIEISPEHINLKIFKKHIAYINVITNDFILLDKKGNEILRSSNVSNFEIDNSTLKSRILLIGNKKLQMIIQK